MNTDGIIGGKELDRWITGNDGVDGEVRRKCQSCGGPMNGVTGTTCPRCDEEPEQDFYDEENTDDIPPRPKTNVAGDAGA